VWLIADEQAIFPRRVVGYFSAPDREMLALERSRAFRARVAAQQMVVRQSERDVESVPRPLSEATRENREYAHKAALIRETLRIEAYEKQRREEEGINSAIEENTTVFDEMRINRAAEVLKAKLEEAKEKIAVVPQVIAASAHGAQVRTRLGS